MDKTEHAANFLARIFARKYSNNYIEVDKNTPAPRSVFCACNARFNDMPFARAPVVMILRPPAHEYDICFERAR